MRPSMGSVGCDAHRSSPGVRSLEKRVGFILVLWSSCLAMLAVGTNSTAIMAALPLMRAELSLPPAGVQWAVNAYLVTVR